MKYSSLLGCWFVLLLTSCLAFSQVNQVEIQLGEQAKSVHNLLQELASKGFSGSIVIEKNGKVILQGGYGYANREKQIPFTSHTISTIGSITKPLTATAIVKLQAEGKLEFEDPISKYINGLKPHLQNITIDQLLTHRSGLGGIMVNNDFATISKEDFLQRLNKLSLKFTPGEKVKYSNIGFSVLAYIIEEISQLDYELFMQETFFIPLQMKSTGYRYYSWPVDSVAQGYRSGKKWGSVYQKIGEMNGEYWNLIGNGGIHMSILDMHKWYLAMKEGNIITDPMMSKMLTPYEKCGPKSITCFQGYAWVVLARDKGQDLVAINHNGGNGVLFGDFWWYVKEEIFIGMLSNNNKYSAIDVLEKVRPLVRN